MAEQNFQNHARFFPPFHFFVAPVMLLNFFWSLYRWRAVHWSLDGFVAVLLAAGLFVGFLCSRLMALSVQDRVIRLEERLRLEKLLPGDLKPRIAEFTTDQLVALRFASDAELPALARKVLDEKITARKPIKALVKNWRPDYLRA
jgi:uncharacterized membrane protein YciS (DUF1049 family)